MLRPPPSSARKAHSVSPADRYGAFVALAARAHRGARFGQPLPTPLDPGWWEYVSSAELEELDSKIENLNTDVISFSLGPMPNPVTEPAAAATWSEKNAWLHGFRWDWVEFYTRWNQWQEKVSQTSLYRLGAQQVAVFDSYRVEYNERLRQFKERAGAKASTAEPSKPAPAGQSGKADVTGTIKMASLAVMAIAAVWIYSQATR